jgi:hypothetical protein
VSSPNGLSATDERLARVRALARLLDTAIRVPGTPIRFGLDALLGLLPAGGDVVGATLSSVIVLTAARWGAPVSVLIRMVANLVFDALLGFVPLVGDLADVGLRANVRNVALLERHLRSAERTRRRSRWALAGVGAALLGILSLLAWGAYVVARTIWLLAF